jgi:ubiquinone/menaquinone biosynthesis C-methylase UbiE
MALPRGTAPKHSGLDFVRWTAPKKGAHVLDLACGSGIVTYPAAQAVGPEGFVVGVDVSTGMLQEAKRKSALQGSGRIKWVEHDISNLNNVEVVQQVVQSGGFDLIMCCSALVLLANPGSSIKQWRSAESNGYRFSVCSELGEGHPFPGEVVR